MNTRLLHKIAWHTGQSIAETLKELEREGKLSEAFVHVYSRVFAGLETLVIEDNRRIDRQQKVSAN